MKNMKHKLFKIKHCDTHMTKMVLNIRLDFLGKKNNYLCEIRYLRHIPSTSIKFIRK